MLVLLFQKVKGVIFIYLVLKILTTPNGYAFCRLISRVVALGKQHDFNVRTVEVFRILRLVWIASKAPGNLILENIYLCYLIYLVCIRLDFMQCIISP